MSKVMSALKDEIRRIARKEIRLAVAGLKRDRAALKKTVAGLKKQMAANQKNCNAMSRALAKTAAAMPAPPVDEGKKARITGKGVRAVRRKLGLSQKAFGKLFGVSSITVQNMEKKDGPLNLRTKTRNAYLAIRGLGAREAKERLK